MTAMTLIATVPVYMLLSRSSWADVNFLLLEDVFLGSTVNSWMMLLVSCSVVVLVSPEFWDVSGGDVVMHVVVDDVTEGVIVAVTVVMMVHVGDAGVASILKASVTI